MKRQRQITLPLSLCYDLLASCGVSRRLRQGALIYELVGRRKKELRMSNKRPACLPLVSCRKMEHNRRWNC